MALVWANSPWRAGYVEVWHGSLDLGHWVNDGLMALFFLVVGREIKRERRAPMVPAAAAIGGMVVPALLYAAVNRGRPGSAGWGIVMATDIAFALGVVGVLGRRVPPAARLFLLTLAVVDDIGAIVVIAVFYAEGVDLMALAAAALVTAAVVVLNRRGVRSLAVYAVAGVVLWLAVYRSGVHPTIAGVVLALAMPAAVGRDLEPKVERWTTAVVLPLFALANAGVAIGASAFDRPGAAAVVAGVVVGLVAGKAVGITGATWLAVRFAGGKLPEGVHWPHVVGIGIVGGVGFTVSLFVAVLAFAGEPALVDSAKVGVLLASTIAALAAFATFSLVGRRQPAR
ncbi:MAG: Na+:H+ antiporter, NhaA family [Actinomycetota bacterium]|nr:Na+:H+ antiporter, NhaA family [Actinomycetota bacterium]